MEGINQEAFMSYSALSARWYVGKRHLIELSGCFQLPLLTVSSSGDPPFQYLSPSRMLWDSTSKTNSGVCVIYALRALYALRVQGALQL